MYSLCHCPLFSDLSPRSFPTRVSGFPTKITSPPSPIVNEPAILFHHWSAVSHPSQRPIYLRHVSVTKCPLFSDRSPRSSFLPQKKEQDVEPNFPSFHWCERDDIRDPCKICQQVLPVDTNTTWKPTPWDTSVTCQRCIDAGCVIPPDEHCCGLCQTTSDPLSDDCQT